MNLLINFMYKFVVLLMLVGLSTGVFSKENETPLHEYLQSLDSKVDKAYKDQNIKFFSSVLAEEFIWVHAGAFPIDSKTSTLKTVAARARNLKKDDVDIRIYGDTAIVSGFVDTGFLKYHMQRVYAKKDVSWQLVYQHTTMNLGEEIRNDVYRYLYENYGDKSSSDDS